MSELNALTPADFVARVGGIFEHSPWITESAAGRRPFPSVEIMQATLFDTVRSSDQEKQLALINAHPDLAGRLARQGQLTAESTREQAAAGLGSTDSAILQKIETLNTAYRARFSFPFIICARLNNVDTIVSAMENRLSNSREVEISTALEEIFKIAQLRLADIVENSYAG